MLKRLFESLGEKAASYEGETPRPVNTFWKFWLLMLVFHICFMAVVYKLFNLQIVQGEEFAAMAKRQSESNITLQAARGDILDRNGNIMATTIYSVSVAVDPYMLGNRELVAQSLSQATGKPAAHFIQKIRESRREGRRFVWLARGIEPDRAAVIRAIEDDGLIVSTQPKRKLPLGSSVGQIVGMVNVDGKGISGIEMSLDSILRGRDGRMILLRDARGNLKPRADLPYINETDGHDIELTIDSRLQRIVELELQRGVEYAEAASATAVALNPHTGEILAMATYPSHNPEEGDWQESSRIRAITDTYEPGSTFKLVTAAASLEEGNVTEDKMFFAHHGTARFRGYAIHDVHKMDSASFRDAIRYSSNIVMAELANQFSDADFYNYVRSFGFGLPTEVELPGENSGKVKKPNEFTKGTKRYMGHGYELAVTPLQICNAYATVANGGKVMKPFIVRRVRDKEGNILAENNPEKIRQVISAETSRRLAPLLEAVVDSGSGTRARVQGLKIAGKTGTSQQIEGGRHSKRNYTATFAGFFPADAPEIAMLVYVDRPRTSIYGGAMAAPIFKNIAARYVNMYPDVSSLQPESSDTLRMPSLYCLRQSQAKTLAEIYGLGFKLKSPSEDEEIDEDAYDPIVFDQRPEAGAVAVRGTDVRYTVVPDKSFAPVVQRRASTKDSTKSRGDEPIEHDFVGTPLSRALAILNKMGIQTKVEGRGHVKRQIWDRDSKGRKRCTLVCG